MNDSINFDCDRILTLSQSETGRIEMSLNRITESICDLLLSKTTRIYNGHIDSTYLQMSRALRNSCAGNKENADTVVKKDILIWIDTYCRQIALFKSDSKDDSDKAIELKNEEEQEPMIDRKFFLLALCQLLSNFAGCGYQYASYLWGPSFGEAGVFELVF